MVSSRVYISRRAVIPERDQRCAPMTGFMTLEQAVHAYMANGSVNLPESPDADFEFPEAPDAHALRGDNVSPTSVDRTDLAAEIQARDYSTAFPLKDAPAPPADTPPEAPAPPQD